MWTQNYSFLFGLLFQVYKEVAGVFEITFSQAIKRIMCGWSHCTVGKTFALYVV